MPTPLRDDGTPGPARKLVLFVHGFFSGLRTWEKLTAILRSDPTISTIFDVQTFEYSTSLVSFGRKRTPQIEEVAIELGKYLERNCFSDKSGNDRFIDVTLVGHSMGGLVIQSYLLQLLNAGRGQDLDQIRQIILFATPNSGSELLKLPRKLLEELFDNPQEAALRPHCEETDRIHRDVRDKIIDARDRGTHEYPLPVYCFWGDADRVVTRASAQGHFPHGEPLQADHRTVHKPDDLRDPKYHAFIDALQHPHGHKNIWEIDTFRYKAKVEPWPIEKLICARYGMSERLLETDNNAIVEREVCFSAHNRCKTKYQLRYATMGGGWIDLIAPRDLERHTTPENLRRYHDHGTEVTIDIAPEDKERALLSMNIYRGFNAGSRDYHMHLNRTAYYRRAEFEVDLTGYVREGWKVTKGPFLYFHPSDPGGDHLLCRTRTMLDPDPPHEFDPGGIWRWSLEYLREGVVDIMWDVTRDATSATSVSPAVIELRTGEHAVFGYGSLLSIESLEKTLGHRYDGPFTVCDLIGWERTWDVAMPNTSFAYQGRDKSWIKPSKILYLNVRRNENKRIRGVLFVLKEKDLAKFDEREWIYDRVAIEDQIRGTSIKGGNVWLFTGKEIFIQYPTHEVNLAAVRQSYLDILETGFKKLGVELMSDYSELMKAVPEHLVIQDHRFDDHLVGAT